ncbi:expressed unknown protein [Seminavis robusta]|uniref:Uncharacterized protein n=1 Tax=Seminavis robusta TaxID=568900 RepID=A0A9N8D5V8_9STRA|nr:expressed unknown protein [Seminavis robusta]|eukprot:Sro12_g009420.1 n/a (257) ;mRNA; f:118399-119341
MCKAMLADKPLKTTSHQRNTTDKMNKFAFMKDMNGSQTTQELSFDLGSDDDVVSDGRPSVILLDEYESQSVGDLSQETMTNSSSSPRRGVLKRRSRLSGARSGRSVTFSEVRVRTYAQCVGDNPAVTLGVPLSLNWQVVKEETSTVDAYDPVHPQGLREEELAIPAAEREQLVRKSGSCTEDIRKAVRAVNSTKMEREKTLDTLKNASSEEFMEKLRKGVRNATLRRKSKKMERALLKQLREKDAKRALVFVPPAC